jgi:CxxC motif-containing protein (DUF1111 family)
VVLGFAGLVGCRSDKPGDSADGMVDDAGLAAVEEGEWLPGDISTNTLLLGSNAFLRPADNLSEDNERAFYSGNSWFNQQFVAAPATTVERDGLGPLQNARTCSGCHFKDGRAAPPAGPGEDPLGMLVRLSIPGTGDHGGVRPEPTYGVQLQDGGNDDVLREGLPSLSWTELDGVYDDGTPYSLRRPTLTVLEPGYGDFHPDVQMSIRVAPHMIGLGLLEGIPEARLAELEDPDDDDDDGISGRRNKVWNPMTNTMGTGRFGWKAEEVSVHVQAAAAFSGDMGVTSSIIPNDDCTEAQQACLAAPSGGDPEFDDDLFRLVSVYSLAVAVPVRRGWDTETILRGKWLFSDAGCAGCHTPSHITGAEAPIPEFEDLFIWPYTDMLLHDMGPGLSDDRPVFAADGREWRTPPLWGLGLVPEVNGHDNLLHDGRARGFAEAILWHGGEAEASMLEFRAMDLEDRAALVAFLESL